MVPTARLELAHLSIPASKTGASTNSARWAITDYLLGWGAPLPNAGLGSRLMTTPAASSAWIIMFLY